MDFPFDRQIVLENERVRLSPLEATHLPYLLSVTENNDKLLQYSPIYVHTEESLKNYIDVYTDERRNRRRYPFAIYDKAVGKYAGSTSFMNISEPNHRLEIGSTWIGYDFQRTGLNRHCKLLLLSFAFEELLAERVEFLTDERNSQSRKAIGEIGATFEGILRSHITMLDGFRRNSVIFSIIKSEWPQVKEHLKGLIKQ